MRTDYVSAPAELLPPTAEEVERTTGRRPVVYVVQETTLNITPAARFGELQVLLPARAQVLITPQPLVRLLRGQLRGYTEHDYVLPVGDPVAIGAATALAAEPACGAVRLLKWDRQESRYYQVVLRLWGAGS